MKNFSVRLAFASAAVNRSGSACACAVAKRWAKSFIEGHSAVGVRGAITEMPLPPVTIGKFTNLFWHEYSFWQRPDKANKRLVHSIS